MFRSTCAVMEDNPVLDVAGLGYGSLQVNPLIFCLNKLQEELEPEDFETMKFLLKGKISKHILARSDPQSSYDEESSANFTQKKLQIFRALEEQFGAEGMLEVIKNILRCEDLSVTWTGKRVSMASIIEEYEEKYQKYLEERRSQGLVIDENFVGREEYIEAIRRDIYRKRKTIEGILICGMYGLGKTSLASRICMYTTDYNTVCVDLRQRLSVKEAVHAVMTKLDQAMPTYEMSVFISALADIKQKTLLYLDNVDYLLDFGTSQNPNLECSEFVSLLTEITKVANPKVVLVMTSRYKMAQADFLITEDVEFRKPRLGGSIMEYELQVLSEADSITLFDKEIGLLKETGILEREKKEVVSVCGYSPMSVRLVASHVKITGGCLTQFLDRTPTTPITPTTPTSPLGQFSMGSLRLDRKVQSILSKVFNALEHKWQVKLMALTIFESSFDVRAAQAIMGSETIVEATLDLQYLKCRHLVEVNDVVQVGPINPYNEATVRYSLHTLTQQYLCLKHADGKCKEILEKAELDFLKYYKKLLKNIGQMAKEDCSKAYQEIANNENHFKKMTTLMQKCQRLFSCEGRKRYFRQMQITMLFQRFLNEGQRIEHFHNQAMIAKKKKVPTATLR